MPKLFTKTLKGIEREKRYELIENKKIDRLNCKLKKREILVPIRLKSELKQKFISKVIKFGYKETDLAREIFQYYFDNKA